ncbi:unnamed protein product [Rotaria sordida]|uniref:Transmembrane protein 33 n=1 Tax=Rotaria sordida TaxID=392033 RepID=A0A815MVL4_9BILA|nr:unnamed protein product [Rotaria sordida]CAF1351561.1 unnamed protein product [Rotaria sordida]CAF1408837.1 unnamed protein product [Rotaria sordida]CAF1424945.1 unnamed protein product [Rotaria sordida]CAF1585271.1 unnamed protein product [Rotaria sordida]
MVLVEDVSTNSDSSPNRNNEASSTASSSSSSSSPPPPPQTSSSSIINTLLERKIDAVLLLSRLATIFYTIMFILPFFHSESNVYYTKALLSAVVTSVLRLRQRLPNFALSREFLFNLFREDSAHYLMYSFLFLSSTPMTIVLIPITTYAILHSCSFLSQILMNFPAMQQLCTRVTENQMILLRFVALNEIVLMPILILSIFVSRSNFLLIFMYYRFLTLRYTSHRNPYTRNLFYELRQSVEYLCNKPACPPFIGRICYNAIAFINRLAPTNG